MIEIRRVISNSGVWELTRELQRAQTEVMKIFCIIISIEILWAWTFIKTPRSKHLLSIYFVGLKSYPINIYKIQKKITLARAPLFTSSWTHPDSYFSSASQTKHNKSLKSLEAQHSERDKCT